MNQENTVRIAYGKLLSRCWKEPDYLAKFREDPAACLEEFGIPTVSGANYHIVKPEEMQPNTEQDIYLPYTEKPKTRELSIDMVDAVASGDMGNFPISNIQTDCTTSVVSHSYSFSNVTAVIAG